MSSQTPAGWYPPDPVQPDQLRYWDGIQWTESALPAEAPGTDPLPEPGRPPAWLTSWPAIFVGFLLCLIPGLVLLWARPGTSKRIKAAVSAAVVGLLVLAGVSDSSDPVDDAAAVSASPDAEVSAPAIPTPSPTPTGTPTDKAAESPTPEPDQSASAPAQGSAVAAVAALPVKGRAPTTGYDRDEFGSGWVDVDRNGCDTRNDMLNAELYDKTMANECKVLAGTLDDPYTGTTIRFEAGGPSEVDVDHLVALSDAWQKGATPWPYAKRVAFANDPLNLQPTDASANRQKGDSDAASWLPPKKSYRCEYVAQQAAVKTKYELWVTAAEQEAMLRVLRACPDQDLPEPGPQPTIASNTGGPPPDAKPILTAKPTKSAPASKLDPQFRTCGEAADAGYGPYYRGTDPEYDWYQDRDGDGSVCE